MTRRVRSWAIAALAVFGLAGAATPSFAEIIYNVTNDLGDQNGWSLAGTITVSGVGTSSSSSLITAWNLTATKQGSASLLLANNAGFQPGVELLSGTLNATSSQLLLNANGYFGFFSQDSVSSAYNGLYWMNKYFGTLSIYSCQKLGGSLWNTSAFSPIVGGAWVLGTTSAVPEIDPAGMGSVLALVTGALGLLERRRLKMA